MKTAGLDIMNVEDFDQDMAKSIVKASNGNVSLVGEKDEENALIYGQIGENGKLYGYGLKETETYKYIGEFKDDLESGIGYKLFTEGNHV